MEKTSKNITYLIWNSLLAAFQEVGIDQFVLRNSQEISCKRILYDKEHNLVVVEIDRSQFQHMPEGFFGTRDLKHSLLVHSNCKWVDVMDLGTNIYFYFGVSSGEIEEPSKVLYPLYAI